MRFQELLAYQKSFHLAMRIFEITKTFPKEEIYGLSSQIRRSSISIPSNIAEGYGRNGNSELLRFLNISISSLFEMQTQLEISFNLKYITEYQFSKTNGESRELERMLSAFIKKLKERK